MNSVTDKRAAGWLGLNFDCISNMKTVDILKILYFRQQQLARIRATV
jgi:hypothetical protein